MFQDERAKTVARFDFFWSLDKVFGQNVMPFGKDLRVEAKRFNVGRRKIYTSKNPSALTPYFKINKVDIIKIYENNWLDIRHEKPTAVIIKNGKGTTILYDLEGDGYLPDGIFDSFDCPIWYPDLVSQVCDRILTTRVKQMSNQ